MTTKNKVNEYLKNIGVDFVTINTVSKDQAVCSLNLMNERFIDAIKTAGFKLDEAMIKKEKTEMYFFNPHNKDAFIKIVKNKLEKPTVRDVAYLSNISLKPQGWILDHISKIGLGNNTEAMKRGKVMQERLKNLFG